MNEHEQLRALKKENDDLRRALFTLGFTDEHALQWLAEGIRPGTIGWALKTIDLYQEGQE